MNKKRSKYNEIFFLPLLFFKYDVLNTAKSQFDCRVTVLSLMYKLRRPNQVVLGSFLGKFGTFLVFGFGTDYYLFLANFYEKGQNSVNYLMQNLMLLKNLRILR